MKKINGLWVEGISLVRSRKFDDVNTVLRVANLWGPRHGG